MLGAIKGTSPLCRSVQDREDLRSLEHVVLGHFAHRGCRCRLCEVGYDVGYWSLLGYIMNMQIWENSITSRGVLSPALWLWLSWMVRSRRARHALSPAYIASLLFLATWLSVSVVVVTSSLLPDFSLVDVSSSLHLNRLESSDMSFSIVCIRKQLPPSPRTC